MSLVVPILLVGVLMLVVGGVSARVAWVAWRKSPTSQQSFLAPVLIVDALDVDLRVPYLKTMVLDARWDAEFPDQDSPHLGAEIRRLVLEVQAERRAGRDLDVAWSELVEPGDDWFAQKTKVRRLRESISGKKRRDESDRVEDST